MKKVILFIVEGLTDKVALEGIIDGIIGKQYALDFCVANEDITSCKKNTAGTIKGTVSTLVEKHLERLSSEDKSVDDLVEEHLAKRNVNRYEKDDIKAIVHLIDTDGGLIAEKCIETKKKAGDKPLEYFDDKIRVASSGYRGICNRNNTKTTITKRLSGEHTICGKPYSIYYFSRDREHSLQNENVYGEWPNTSRKRMLAEEFEDKYIDDPDGFLALLSSICPSGDYATSWRHIFKETNSLKRFSNFKLFFDSLAL